MVKSSREFQLRQKASASRWVALLWAMAVLQMRAGTVRVELDRFFMESGDAVPLKVIVEDAQPTVVPRLPPIPLIAGVEYLGPEQRSQIINGVSSFQVTFRYRIQLRGEGDLVIPAITVSTKTGELRTVPVSGRILAPTQTTNSVSLKIYTGRDFCYVGEVLLYELQLQVGVNLREASPPKISFDGFVTGRSTPNQSAQFLRNGSVVGVLTSRMTATPTKEGDLILGPASQEVVVDTGRRRARSLLDSFFGGNEDAERRTVEAQGQPIRVNPLPSEGRPVGFSGAIGRFTVEASVSRTNLVVGDAITLRYTVAGSGTFDGLPSPQLVVTEGLKIYPSTNAFVADDALGLYGKKTFEEVVLVENSGTQSLSFAPYSFFDPTTGQYTTARLKPVAIRVREMGSREKPAPPMPAADMLGGEGKPIKQKGGLQPLFAASGGRLSVRPFWATESWFFGLILVPFLGVGLFSGWSELRRRGRHTNRPTRRDMDRLSVQQQVGILRSTAESGDSRHFFDALNEVLRQQVALTLGLPFAAAVTTGDMDRSLLERGISVETVEKLNRLFIAADAVRFAPTALPDELAALRDLAEVVLAELKSLEDKG